MSVYTFHRPQTPVWPGRSQVEIETYVDDCIDADLVHSIHTSERRAFRSCRQRWDWAYREDLHTTGSIRALEFGLAYHHAMEIFYDPATWHLDKRVLAITAKTAFKQYTMETYLALCKANGDALDDRLKDDFALRIEEGEAMLSYYFDDVAPIHDTFVPLKVEVAFEVPIFTPAGEYVLCKCDRCRQRAEARIPFPGGVWGDWFGLPVTIGGRLDLLGKDIETQELGVLDWKTAQTLMNDQEVGFLELDDQISTYLLAMHKLGVPARQFWYHEQRKASPQPPEPLNRKYRGRLYQASKDLPTSYDLYLETVTEGDPLGVAAGAYDEYLHYLKTEGPRFHQRVTLRRNNAQLAATEEAILNEYIDMVSGRIYPNPSRRTCTWCQFYDPCLGKQRGEGYQHGLDTLFVKGRILK